jgi:hypothetical protein
MLNTSNGSGTQATKVTIHAFSNMQPRTQNLRTRSVKTCASVVHFTTTFLKPRLCFQTTAVETIPNNMASTARRAVTL